MFKKLSGGNNSNSLLLSNRDVGSISSFFKLLQSETTLRGHFFPKKKGAFPKIKRALLCLLQNLAGGTCPQCPPVPTSILSIWLCLILLLAQKLYVFVFLAEFEENFVSFVTANSTRIVPNNSFILFQDL